MVNGRRSVSRLHGDGIIAQVDQTPLGKWEVQVWNAETTADPVTTAQRQYPLLTSAQAAADYAARTRFKHSCDVTKCRVWVPWTNSEP